MACFSIYYTHQYLPLPVYKVPAIRVNTTKSTYTFTSVVYCKDSRNEQSFTNDPDVTIISKYRFPAQIDYNKCREEIAGSLQEFWFKLYFICIIYDKYTNNTEYNINTTTIQMGFRRKSND